MSTKKELLNMIENNPDLCDLGYQYAEIDRRGYCLWVIDCAKHILPLAQPHLKNSDITQLTNSLNCGYQFLSGRSDTADLMNAINTIQNIANLYYKSNSKIVYYLMETFDAIVNSLRLTMPSSPVYHEDVIYAAARAALNGRLHDEDSKSILEELDCNNKDELEGSEESALEIQWQLQALKKRLLESFHN